MRTPLIKAIDALYDVTKQKIVLDFSEVQLLHPMGTVHLLHNLKKIAEKDSHKIQLSGKYSDKSLIVNGMLTKMGISNILGLIDQPLEHEMIDKWRICHGKTATLDDEFDAVIGVFLREIFGASSEAYHKFYEAIGEAILNASSHAYDRGAIYKGWVVAVANIEDKLCVVISDLGKTVPKTAPLTLADIFVGKIWRHYKDSKLINIASQYRKSSTGKSNRGKGFSDMQDVCDEIPDALLFVASKNGLWSYSKNRTETHDFKDEVNGTIVAWVVPIDPEPSAILRAS